MTMRRIDYQRCATAGMTVAETAECLGVTVKAAQSMSERYGMRFAKSTLGLPPFGDPRNTRVKAWSVSPAAIARYFGTP
jgi:hypothetical protein